MKREFVLYYMAVLSVGAIGVWVPPFISGFCYKEVCICIGTFAVPTIVNTLIEKILVERKTMEFDKIASYLACIVLIPLSFVFEVLSVNSNVMMTVFTLILLISVIFFLYKRSSDIFINQSNDSPIGGPVK